MLCLWHVWKAWAENVVQKIADPNLCVAVLKGIADMIYTRDGKKGQNAVAHAEQKFFDFKAQFSMFKEFVDYFEKQWMGNMSMWVIGFQNIPHVDQDTNAAVESYHANMKSILFSSQQQLSGCRIDWLIYQGTSMVKQTKKVLRYGEIQTFWSNAI